MSKIILPKILKGTRDHGPSEMVKRKYVMQKIEDIFKRFGYDTIETPAIEYAETILGKYGEEGDRLTYSFKDRGDRNIALRFDQTVPFARYVAMNHNDLPLPFKRYQISRVWRADKPQKGRYREFYQCDIDIIGTDSLLADAEIANVIYTVFKELGFKKYIIKVNTRRLTNAILDQVGIKDKHIEVIRILDKLEKIGKERIYEELAKIEISISAIDKIFEMINIEGSNYQKLKKINLPETDELLEFLKYCEALEIPEDFLEIDISIARGLDYYTGIVFETIIEEPAIGSLCGGGRYDDLCSLFCQKSFPGTGVAFGFERIVLVMDELGMLDDLGLNAQILVTVFSHEDRVASIKILNKLQFAGINSEIFIEDAKLAKQFKYADKKKIPYVIVQGPTEIEAGKVQLKNMASGEQTLLEIEEVIKLIKK